MISATVRDSPGAVVVVHCFFLDVQLACYLHTERLRGGQFLSSQVMAMCYKPPELLSSKNPTYGLPADMFVVFIVPFFTWQTRTPNSPLLHSESPHAVVTPTRYLCFVLTCILLGGVWAVC